MAPREPFLSKDRLNRRLESLREERNAHIRDWQDITDFIRPQRGKYLWKTQEESRRPTKVINGSPGIASRTLRSGLLAGVSSPAYPWFRLQYAGDPDLNRYGPAKLYLEARQNILYRVLARSNFYNTAQVAYGDAGDFGNTVMIMDSHPQSIINCYLSSPGEYFFGQGYSGDIDTVYREYSCTTSQLVAKFGLQNVSQTIRDQYDKGEYDKRHKVATAIEPNLDMEPGRGGWRGMPWICVSWEKDGGDDPSGPGIRDNQGKKLLELRGYESWPAPNLRWDLDSGNVYGSGCGLVALGDARALQTIERRKGQAIDKLITPPLQGPPSLKNSTVSHVPGGMTYVDPLGAGANGAIRELYALNYNSVTVVSTEILLHQDRIDQAYFKDLFLLLATTDRREITAREVEEKHEEKLLALGPMLQRTHRDFLDNVITRSDHIVARMGLYPPPPPELEEALMEVEYVSTLAHAQRAVNVSSIERVFMFAGTIAQGYPAALKKLDPLEAIDNYADTLGVPAKIIVPNEKAQEALAAEQEAMAAAQSAELAPKVAGAAKQLSETDVNQPSALREIVRAGGQL